MSINQDALLNAARSRNGSDISGQILNTPNGPRAIPPVPQTIADVGVDEDFIKDLLLKTLYYLNRPSGQKLADELELPYHIIDPIIQNMRQELLIEVVSAESGLTRTFRYSMTTKGIERAREAMQFSQYVGPCPIPLDVYREWVLKQTLEGMRITRDMLVNGFKKLVVAPEMVDELGPAVNNFRSLFIFGPPGNGKTTMAEAIADILPGWVFVPHAISVDRHIIRVYDQTVHRPVDVPAGLVYDRRFMACRRPLVMVGGELKLESLDLIYDDIAKFYEAPYQMKANCGIFLIDDFGRQQCSPTDLLNRWIVPLEKRVDFLTLYNGKKIDLPFQMLIIFATNLDPRQLTQEAFLRRITNKVQVKNPTPEQFAEILHRVCEAKKIPWSQDGWSYLFYSQYYDRERNLWKRPMRAVHPRDIISQIISIASFRGVSPEMEPSLIDQACKNVFLTVTEL